MDTGFILQIKTKYFFADIAKDAETRFDILSYELDRPLPKEKKKKVTELMKDKLGGKIMKESAALRGKTYHYLRDNSVEDKLTKSTKKCIIK